MNKTREGQWAALLGIAWWALLATAPLSAQEPATLKGHTFYVSSVCFSPDGKRIASASHYGTVKVWDALSGQEILSLKEPTTFLHSVCFSPDGRRLASAGSGDPYKPHEVKVWDAHTGQDLLTLKGHTSHVSSVCFSPDGKRIASGSLDKTVRVWDAPRADE